MPISRLTNHDWTLRWDNRDMMMNVTKRMFFYCLPSSGSGKKTLLDVIARRYDTHHDGFLLFSVVFILFFNDNFQGTGTNSRTDFTQRSSYVDAIIPGLVCFHYNAQVPSNGGAKRKADHVLCRAPHNWYRNCFILSLETDSINNAQNN